jgi:CubicO group peptidase (beta-lactamase class C family)
MNKMFTAIGIMQLVQNKEISLDDYVGKYFPTYPNQAVRNVTIRQLLNHTAGTGNIFGPEFEQNVDRLKSPQDYIDLFGERGLNHAPGEAWSYSNYGYVLLGRIIEITSGQDYYQYIQENIYNPAGMKDSGSFYQTDSVDNLATGFTFNEQNSRLENNSSTLPVRGSPAGGGYATAPNLLNFANALTEYRLLDREHTELLTAHLVDTGENDRYGYGFAVAPEGEIAWFGHSGGHFGVNSSLDIYPDSDYTVIVMTNLDKPTANREAQWIRARLPAIQIAD